MAAHDAVESMPIFRGIRTQRPAIRRAAVWNLYLQLT
jgi:hypothetical protein